MKYNTKTIFTIYGMFILQFCFSQDIAITKDKFNLEPFENIYVEEFIINGNIEGIFHDSRFKCLEKFNFKGDNYILISYGIDYSCLIRKKIKDWEFVKKFDSPCIDIPGLTCDIIIRSKDDLVKYIKYKYGFYSILYISGLYEGKIKPKYYSDIEKIISTNKLEIRNNSIIYFYFSYEFDKSIYKYEIKLDDYRIINEKIVIKKGIIIEPVGYGIRM